MEIEEDAYGIQSTNNQSSLDNKSLHEDEVSDSVTLPPQEAHKEMKK